MYPGFTEARQHWRDIFGKRCVSCGHRVLRFHRGGLLFGVQTTPTWHHRCGRGATYSMWIEYDRAPDGVLRWYV